MLLAANSPSRAENMGEFCQLWRDFVNFHVMLTGPSGFRRIPVGCNVMCKIIQCQMCQNTFVGRNKCQRSIEQWYGSCLQSWS